MGFQSPQDVTCLALRNYGIDNGVFLHAECLKPRYHKLVNEVANVRCSSPLQMFLPITVCCTTQGQSQILGQTSVAFGPGRQLTHTDGVHKRHQSKTQTDTCFSEVCCPCETSHQQVNFELLSDVFRTHCRQSRWLFHNKELHLYVHDCSLGSSTRSFCADTASLSWISAPFLAADPACAICPMGSSWFVIPFFFLRLPNGQYGPVSRMFQPKTRYYTGPFNWGGAHCAGEKVKRKTGPFLQKSHQKQAKANRAQPATVTRNPPARLPGTRAKKQTTPHQETSNTDPGTP